MRKVRIGPIVYQIVEVDGLKENGRGLFGEVKYGSCEIRVEGRNCGQQKRQTIWHEVVHIILTQVGLAKDAGREGLVDSLAYGMLQVVQDNPWLVKAFEEDDAG